MFYYLVGLISSAQRYYDSEDKSKAKPFIDKFDQKFTESNEVREMYPDDCKQMMVTRKALEKHIQKI
jgi:hypothetical protein